MTKLTDEELAEKTAEMMGWNKIKRVGVWSYEIPWAGGVTYWKPVGDWNPCNDWNDMRLVIEKLHDEGYAVTLEFNHKRSERNKTGISDWTVGIDYIDPSGEHTDIYSADDVKPGRAVCIAALKAAGVDVE